jgi:hypothetical protein
LGVDPTKAAESGSWGDPVSMALGNIAQKVVNPTTNQAVLKPIEFTSAAGEQTISLELIPTSQTLHITSRITVGTLITEQTTDLTLNSLKAYVDQHKTTRYNMVANYPIYKNIDSNTLQASIGIPFIWLFLTINTSGVVIDSLQIVLRAPGDSCQLNDMPLGSLTTDQLKQMNAIHEYITSSDTATKQ